MALPLLCLTMGLPLLGAGLPLLGAPHKVTHTSTGLFFEMTHQTTRPFNIVSLLMTHMITVPDMEPHGR